MKDIMIYLNHHIGRVEVEPGNLINGTQLQSQQGVYDKWCESQISFIDISESQNKLI